MKRIKHLAFLCCCALSFAGCSGWGRAKAAQENTSLLARQMLGIDRPDLFDPGQKTPERQREFEEQLREYEKKVEQNSRELRRQVNLRVSLGEAQQMLGLTYYNYGMFSSALEQFDLAIDAVGNDPMLFYYRGLCHSWLYKNSNDPEEREFHLSAADGDYRRSLDLKKNGSKALYALAVLRHFEQERSGEALLLLQDYLMYRQMDRSNSLTDIADTKALFLAAQCAAAVGETSAAIEYYDWIAASTRDDAVRDQAAMLRDRVIAGG